MNRRKAIKNISVIVAGIALIPSSEADEQLAMEKRFPLWSQEVVYPYRFKKGDRVVHRHPKSSRKGSVEGTVLRRKRSTNGWAMYLVRWTRDRNSEWWEVNYGLAMA